ncbi:MAG: peroxiredoxin [Myxococcales bacterium]|nr:peroxiredoxin [Myxococcales bacterium]MCB9579066.1 peroxiredoxin [Polyangiaceae bacterium]
MARVLLRLLVAAIALLLSCGGDRANARSPHLEAISVAPDFRAPDETGKVRTLSEFRGHPVVLYFYPKDGTPGCTREACAFRDAWDQLQRDGARVVGVSVDSVESHAAFKKAHRLPFPLLSDEDGTVLAAYGVPRSPQGYAARTTFVIDSQGMIRRIFPEVDPALHLSEVLSVLDQLKAEGLDQAQDSTSSK